MNHSQSNHILKALLLTLLITGLLLGTSPFSNSTPIARASAASPQGWITNPVTLSQYKIITGCSGWHACENIAVSQGAHLVTVNDADEQAWLVSTFGSADLFWIGFTDENDEGNWRWLSGETPVYTNWYPGEPSNSGNNEHYALMNWSVPGKWNDGHEAAITMAIIERPSWGMFLPLGVNNSIILPLGWVFNPANMHFYRQVNNCTGWHACESMATGVGGHLVTVNDAAEQSWLVSTFGGADLFWIGYTDENDEGNWSWVSGESSAYTNWYPGEPSNSGNNEHYALMNWSIPGKWNDGHEAAITRAIIEVSDLP